MWDLGVTSASHRPEGEPPTKSVFQVSFVEVPQDCVSPLGASPSARAGLIIGVGLGAGISVALAQGEFPQVLYSGKDCGARRL